ncbi:TIGR02680 family protein [Actinokineospora enzanensis]|uniref:TIGR02680 family protein n=1 Tax=Actinokineospora enzanensis TaxID=155975 RepID=UPI00037C7B17|nr:TIGR02680 family protein [Actinokineospora enzanensis]
MTVTELPTAVVWPDESTEERWRPARAGILNVWRYYDEVFTFHRGRLLLRGPNGTGKSKALELLLPFLFDANLRANRLSTFGTSERTMHWNMMGDGQRGKTRVGYVWLEFRRDSTWFTCGARLQASEHTSQVHSDYFTTSQRVGTDLHLTNASGQPLTRAALTEALGEHGTLHTNAGEYRSAIRESLFGGISEQRYDSLITALLQLRMPKLSQHLDPANLSRLLSAALPPLGESEIAELAEGFERLDRQREQLVRLDKQVDAAKELAGRQQTYARRVLRAGAADLVSTTTELDRLGRRAHESEEEFTRAELAKESEEQRAETLTRQVEEVVGSIDGLQNSEEYKQGKELDRLAEQVGQVKRRAGEERKAADRARQAAERDAENAERARDDADSHRSEADRLMAEARQAAAEASMSSTQAELANMLEHKPRVLLRAAVKNRFGQIEAVRSVLSEHERAIDKRRMHEQQLEAARATLADASRAERERRDEHGVQVATLAEQLLEWARTCRELRFEDPEAPADAVESESAVLALVADAVDRAAQDIARARALTESERDTAQSDRDTTAAEIERLRREQDLPPAPPPTRTADRTGRAGAPLWRLVRFSDDSDETKHGAIEAALQAAGLLDAWIGPSGGIEGHDTFADPTMLPPTPGRSLASVLVPESDAPVPTEAIERLLGVIALDDNHIVAVGSDGQWRLGPLVGSWHKPVAEHIGAHAREQARQRRVSELTAELRAIEDRLASTRAALSELDSRRAALDAERKARPGHAAMHESARRLRQAESRTRACDDAVARTVVAVQEQEAEVTRALRQLAALAAEHGLPTEKTLVDRVAELVESFRELAEIWLENHDTALAREREAASRADIAERSAIDAAEREGIAAEAESEHRRLAATFAAARNAITTSYHQVLEQLRALREQRDQLRDDARTASRRITELATELGRLNQQRDTDRQARDNATDRRNTAARRFRELCAGTFPEDAGVPDATTFRTDLGATDAVRPTLDAARAVAAQWPTVPHEPRNVNESFGRLSDTLHDCRTRLGDRAHLDLATDDTVAVLTAVVDGARIGAAELLEVLRAEAASAAKDITEHERDLFDRTLTGDTRRHLAERIRQANALKDTMNTHLEQVRTASKVAVKLVWEVAADQPPGTKAARDLLLKNPVALSESDREALHRFFREQVEIARGNDTATSWEQQLAEVFDYTRWHQFVVKLDRANGSGWQVLTKRLHGALSGGEKAIALHLPLFAAVAAHYQAVPAAPRVILLDEVFVGVDTVNRGQVFGLLAALDLDLVLTSDHEWCQYRELDGIAIHQLITGDDGDDAVTTARFTWDGQQRTPDDPD